GRIQIRLQRVNSHIELAVSDTGVGISPEFLPYVFDRFRQADAGITRERGGLGLGLSIVRQLVELHGGSIDASSGGPGLGATFRIQLPVMSVHPVRQEIRRVHPRAISRPAESVRMDLGGVHVLAVDDEPDALALVREALQSAGARVTT